MTTPPEQVSTQVPAAFRRPLIERVAELEKLVAKMASLHNDFAADVARELGLIDGSNPPA